MCAVPGWQCGGAYLYVSMSERHPANMYSFGSNSLPIQAGVYIWSLLVVRNVYSEPGHSALKNPCLWNRAVLTAGSSHVTPHLPQHVRHQVGQFKLMAANSGLFACLHVHCNLHPRGVRVDKLTKASEITEKKHPPKRHCRSFPGAPVVVRSAVAGERPSSAKGADAKPWSDAAGSALRLLLRTY